MTAFVTSDTHFYHKNILKYQPDERPFRDIEHMNESIISRWNSMVTEHDDIYHLGDFAFAKHAEILEILKRLNGNKFFIFGNHDKQMRSAEVARHFVWMRHYHEMKVAGTEVVLNHFPIFSWNKMHHGSMHFYGHTHGSIPFVFEGQSKDVGVDTNECYPYNLELLIDEMRNLRADKGLTIVDARNKRIAR